MNIIKCIIKTYFGSIVTGSLYLWLIHDQFQVHERWFVFMAMVIGNFLMSTGYFIAILIPFGYIFKPMIAALNYQQAIQKYLFYFALLPMFLVGVCIAIGLDFVSDAIQFSLLCVDLSSIVFIGIIHFLQQKTIHAS